MRRVRRAVDAVGDGLAEYDPDAGRTVFRLGNNATAANGGRLEPGQTVCAPFRVAGRRRRPADDRDCQPGYASFIGLTLGTQFPEECPTP